MKININEFIIWINELNAAPEKLQEVLENLIKCLKEWAKEDRKTEFNLKEDPFRFADFLAMVYPAHKAAIMAYTFGMLMKDYINAVENKREETLHSGLQEKVLN